jgi:hypothetical protein
MLLSSKDLCHAVGWHIVSVNPLDVQAAGLNLLSYPGLMDINVLKLRVQLVLLLCRNTNSLLIVTPKGWSFVQLKGHSLEEARPFFHL